MISRETLNKSILAPLKAVPSRCGIDGKAFIQRLPRRSMTKYYDRVYKYAFLLLFNREDAEDVTSETFLAAYTDFGCYDSRKASVATWLTRIAHNRAVNMMRSAAYTRR